MKDTASQRKFKSVADVLELVLAEPASKYSNSMHSSSEGEDFHSQSPAVEPSAIMGRWTQAEVINQSINQFITQQRTNGHLQVAIYNIHSYGARQ